MLESKVPKDIKGYKTKVLGPFTLRQVICTTIAAALDIALYSVVSQFLTIPYDMLIYIAVIIDLPIMAFTFSPRGIPMEVYVREVVIKSFIYPTKRVVDTRTEKEKITYTKKELKESKKKLKTLQKIHPEYIPYE